MMILPQTSFRYAYPRIMTRKKINPFGYYKTIVAYCQVIFLQSAGDLTCEVKIKSNYPICPAVFLLLRVKKRCQIRNE
ncbi:MAG: hypothetical protein AVO34_11120 [Firmicutes bacterium ML8_F2]|nr:MAG: hypothetical protein AVO34_11120 [Firmicutes bacterium ML8_F2]